MAKRGSSTKYKDILQIGDALNERHSQYVEQYVHRAHTELYQLLAEIMRYAKTITDRKERESVIVTMRKELKDRYQINTTTKTGDLGVVLRFVLRGAHRKTIFTYKRVIQHALDIDVDADDLADYLETNGGIEKLSQSNAQVATAKQQIDKKRHMAAFGKQLLNEFASTPLATFKIDRVHDNRMHDASVGGSFRYMICAYDGNYQVLDIVPMYGELEVEVLSQVACDIGNRRIYMTEDELIRFEKVKYAYALSNKLQRSEKNEAVHKAANEDAIKGQLDVA
jgi:hypothetical protein